MDAEAATLEGELRDWLIGDWHCGGGVGNTTSTFSSRLKNPRVSTPRALFVVAMCRLETGYSSMTPVF
jgi:hypothetical protein